MAEKYGTVPPRFTRAWWEYFWEYYKWHVIITAAAILITVVTIVQCASRKEYDFIVVYGGYMHLDETSENILDETARNYAVDADDSGEILTHIVPLEFTNIDGNEDYDMAIQQKLDITFMDDCTFIYLMDDTLAQRYAERKDTMVAFENIEEIVDTSGVEVLRHAPENTGFAVSLKDSTYLKEKGIKCDKLYLLVRRNMRGGEENDRAYDAAVNMARELIR